MDPHAQYEIRVFAQAIYDIVQPLFPAAVEAFDDYVREATTNSRMETALLRVLLTSHLPAQNAFEKAITEAGSEKDFAEANDLSLRELREFQERWGLKAPDVTVQLEQFAPEAVKTPLPTPKKRAPRKPKA